MTPWDRWLKFISRPTSESGLAFPGQSGEGDYGDSGLRFGPKSSPSEAERQSGGQEDAEAGERSMSERTTIDLDIPHDAAERIAREDAYNGRFRECIVEVLRKYGISLDDAPLSALAMAMARMNPPQPEAER